MLHKPKGDGDLRGPGDVERARVAAIPRVHVALGARLVSVEEPPNNFLVWHIEDAVSASAVPTTNCKLVCTESCECVSSLCPLVFIWSQYSKNSLQENVQRS